MHRASPTVALFVCCLLSAGPSLAVPPLPYAKLEASVAAGTEVVRDAVQRSYQKCRKNAVSADRCEVVLRASYEHLREIEARLRSVVRSASAPHGMQTWAAACVTGETTFEDMVDCLQSAIDRAQGAADGKLVSSP